MTRVLVVDDEEAIRLLCRVNLEAEGMSVDEAADGHSGLERARTGSPDVILLDVMMPGLDGWQVAEELVGDERTRQIPIVFLTARADFRDRERGLEAGGGSDPPRPDRHRRRLPHHWPRLDVLPLSPSRRSWAWGRRSPAPSFFP